MLNYAVFFFVIALVAAAFGFSGDAVGADVAVGALGADGAVSVVAIAKVLFLVFAALAATSFLIGLLRRT